MPNKALVLVDFENEWLNPKSEYCVGKINDLLKRANKLIDYCRRQKYKIIFTTHIEKESKSPFAPNAFASQIIEQLRRSPQDVLIKKYKISPFYKTKLDNELKNIKHVVVCGILTNLCVRSFVQDAYDRDLNITVIKDCCKSFDNKTQTFTFEDLKATREEIIFTNLNQFIK